MPQQNLDQLRAQHALANVGDLKRSAIAGLPALIVNNGLLATAAFCQADGGGDNRQHQQTALNVMIAFLRERHLVSSTDTRRFLRDLSGISSDQLQRITAESLSYLSFLKRFAKKDA